MGQETVTYLTNIIICTILACLMTHYWMAQGRTAAMRYWMIAAWIMTVADVFFAMRSGLPYWFGRLVPPLLVTAGHAALFLGTQRTAGLRLRKRLIWGVLGLHAASLIFFIWQNEYSSWRMVSNGLIWGGLSLASAWCLYRASPYYFKPAFAPAKIFLAHAVFHALRVALAALFTLQGWEGAALALQVVGDLEVSFFMVALFAGILIANLQVRHDELSSAHAEVQTLSGLLPICAWCKKVRNDKGYWQQLEEYFSCRSQITFTHGVCVDCLEDQKAESRELSRR
ncbi:hypothetical protein ESB00_05340 [Oleiharenicola lentus]|jgi:hypothetical protein|uniref:Uncharacterized protein n=1 Tax=Oleiharenicola lentus TaxID=2508720 RepID=A0A4Q1C8P0_9BACT|nr:hypothetical protein [Oleiharenicola lentus]RXK55323.1 hypothetical protein ESB00_05340 [Oleiharenicola lentus]